MLSNEATGFLYSITSSARARSPAGTKGLSDLPVDDRFERARLHSRQIRKLLTIGDAADIDADLAPRISISVPYPSG